MSLPSNALDMWLLEAKVNHICQARAAVQPPVNSLAGSAVTQKPAHAVVACHRLRAAYAVVLASLSILCGNRPTAQDIHIEYINARVPALGD